jgi:hypothetical protein
LTWVSGTILSARPKLLFPGSCMAVKWFWAVAPLLAEAVRCQPLYNKTFFPLWACRRAGHSDCACPLVIKICNQPCCLLESSWLISRVPFGLRLMDDLTL